VNTDPRQTLAVSRMSVLQIVAVALTIALNALDGFDVMSISFASPGIAAEWGISGRPRHSVVDGAARHGDRIARPRQCR
jgi:hypothetical protein